MKLYVTKWSPCFYILLKLQKKYYNIEHFYIHKSMISVNGTSHILNEI